MPGPRLVAIIAACALAGFAAGQEPSAGKGDIEPTDVDVQPIAAQKDAKTGFLVGGVNKTDLIRDLKEINGRTIAELEEDMRPGKLSRKGFLGAKESLLGILAEDNELVVGKLHANHQQLALAMRVAAAVGKKHNDDDWHSFRYRGRRFRVKVVCYRGIQDSPFNDETKANCEATVENLDTGKQVRYSLLLPLMIERYGFYEGHGTPYRVEPGAIIDVFDFLHAKQRPQ